MLSHLKLDNFKIWRTTGPLRLAPLTLLLGTNSSGKSSLIQSLLLIRQTVKSDDPNIDLNLGNPDNDYANGKADSVTLGQFQDVLCRSASASASTPANQFGIEFRWQEEPGSHESSLFSARYRKGSGNSAELDSLRLGKGEQGFTVQRKKAGIYQLNLASERKPLGQSADFRPERSFAFSAATLNKLGDRADAIRDIGPELLDELSRIIYLGPVRRLAQRDYVWAGRMPAHIGDDGARAIDALIASGVEYQQLKKSRKPLNDTARLFEQTAYWLKKMNLADGLNVKQLGRSARYELHIVNYGEGSNIKDVGVGVSQVLPVIVATLFAQPGHIVLIEEPESHLHPLAQSELAELLSQVSRERHVQFIVETHSEHLFRRLQTLTAQEVISEKETALYFVERDGKTAKMRPLELDEFGRLKNWPDKFFGDAMGETREQARLVFEKQAQK
ncbi:AAA family ATPase [Thalassolituus sp. LLYu03]|uniref:AAA family ATPase n=1 Tax=Thalassolituus sp. LLYu03 TaxID=3421656 RepID=UPI003D2844E8